MSDKAKDPKEVLRMIAADMEADAKAFDGQPFNGRTVATYFGNQGAAIAALANIVATLTPPPQHNDKAWTILTPEQTAALTAAIQALDYHVRNGHTGCGVSAEAIEKLERAFGL